MVVRTPVANENAARRAEAEAPALAEADRLRSEIERLLATQAELSAAHDELIWRAAHVEDSRRRVMEAHESAKRVVAEELHGRVQTLLYANWLKLSNLLDRLEARNAPEAAELAALVADLNSIRENEVRKLAHRLHPSVIRLGLGPALKSLVDSIGGLVDAELAISDEMVELETDRESQIPENVRLGIYRVAELAIGNVARHSNAQHCTVKLKICDTGELALSVTDDGAGFPPNAKASTGMGIATMDDYADALGGRLKITSYPGKGTRVEMRVPLDRWQRRDEKHPAAVGTLVDMHWAAPDGAAAE